MRPRGRASLAGSTDRNSIVNVPGEFEPAPISNPNHKGREARTIVCPICRRTLHPWGASGQVFCTPRCTGQARRRGLQPFRQPVESKPDPLGLGAPEEELALFLERLEAGELYESSHDPDRERS